MASPGTGGLEELSRTLRELRRPPDRPAAHRTLAWAEAASGFTASKINRMERGKSIPTPEDAVTLARTYGATPEVVARIKALAEKAREGQRVVLTRPTREAFQRHLSDLDQASEQIREFSPVIIPGLLQTPEYMWAIANSGTPDRAAATKFVHARHGRQAILDDPDRRVTVITTEGGLGWAGGADAPTMVRQLDHIAEVSRKHPWKVGIIPFGVRAAIFPVASWTLYDEREVVPGIPGRQVVLKGFDVEAYVAEFEALRPLAAFGADARDILASVADRYRAL